jgi:peroxiredoxin
LRQLRTAPILWGLLTIFAAAIAGGYVYHRLTLGDHSTRVAAETASAARIVTIPEVLPKFTLSNLHGEPVPVSTWAGQSLIINFWATWCAPCRREIPLLKSLDNERRAKGMRVIGIAVDDREAVAAYAAKMQIGYPLLVGEQDALDLIAALGVAEPAFPFSVFTDRRGRIVSLHLGELHRPVAEEILAKIDDLEQHQRDIGEVRREIAADLARF